MRNLLGWLRLGWLKIPQSNQTYMKLPYSHYVFAIIDVASLDDVVVVVVVVFAIACVCEQNTPFVQALAMQSSSRNCNPAPDFVF